MSQFTPAGLGWSRDLPDWRDYHPQHEAVAPLFDGLPTLTNLPEEVDLREFSAIDDQLDLPAGAAHACLALAAYHERRATGRLWELSRLFLHQAARRLGDGTSLRTNLQALVRYGAPPEPLWPYDPAHVGAVPDPFLFGFQRPFSDVVYLRAERATADPDAVLAGIKAFLAAGFAMAFGFVVARAIGEDGQIPFPRRSDSPLGGQAAVVVGYDDHRRVHSDRGALCVRLSWGRQWGEDGYGWLPYAFVREELAADFWTMSKLDWLASDEFARPM